MKIKNFIVLMMLSLCFISFASEFSAAVEDSVKANEEKWIAPYIEKKEIDKKEKRQKLVEEIARQQDEEARKNHEAKLAAAEEEKRIKEAKQEAKRKEAIATQPDEVLLKMIMIPDLKIKMLRTEVSSGLYESVTGVQKEGRAVTEAVTDVSLIDIINFCNKLSIACGLQPYYKDPKWEFYYKSKVIDRETYLKKKGSVVYFKCAVDSSANGFRLPTKDEWFYAAKGGQEYRYFGSDNFNEVGSEFITVGIAELATKKPNGYGLYDMSGNVREVCLPSKCDLNLSSDDVIPVADNGKDSVASIEKYRDAFYGYNYCRNIYSFPMTGDNKIGFRIVCNAE